MYLNIFNIYVIRIYMTDNIHIINIYRYIFDIYEPV